MSACILTSLTPDALATPVDASARTGLRRAAGAVIVPSVILVFLLTALVSVPAAIPAAPMQRITFRTDDGVTVAATWYETESRPSPAVIFVHMLQKSRRDWDQVASEMAAQGIAGLAIDLRGHGETPGSPQDYTGMVQDVRAARRFLAARPDVTPGRIGIAGASMGATLAALSAAEDTTVAALALLSPSLDYRGVRIEGAVKKYAGRPLLLVASDDDGYAGRTLKELEKIGGSRRETMLLPRAGHGTAMLAGSPDLGRRLLEWFRRTLL
jgi:uncharacterized protein